MTDRQLNIFGKPLESALMLFAVAGALLFAMSKGFALLTLSRALIGLGVAAAFTGGLKAIAQWLPKDRISTMNGYLLNFRRHFVIACRN